VRRINIHLLQCGDRELQAVVTAVSKLWQWALRICYFQEIMYGNYITVIYFNKFPIVGRLPVAAH
jgi:hypothetical protein